jgi:hypothetical protein
LRHIIIDFFHSLYRADEDPENMPVTFPRLLPKHLDSLMSSVTMEEVDRAFFDMDPRRLALTGFQQSEKTVSCERFHRGEIAEELNKSLIVLIAKVEKEVTAFAVSSYH